MYSYASCLRVSTSQCQLLKCACVCAFVCMCVCVIDIMTGSLHTAPGASDADQSNESESDELHESVAGGEVEKCNGEEDDWGGDEDEWVGEEDDCDGEEGEWGCEEDDCDGEEGEWGCEEGNEGDDDEANDQVCDEVIDGNEVEEWHSYEVDESQYKEPTERDNDAVDTVNSGVVDEVDLSVNKRDNDEVSESGTCSSGMCAIQYILLPRLFHLHVCTQY